MDSTTAHTVITVTDGVELEAELAQGTESLGVVITHPHPLHGGSMHTPVPQQLFDTARRLSLPAIRFNFRGVGKSTGTHDKGVAEQQDVLGAVEHLGNNSDIDRVLIAGWSFGADVGLAVCPPTTAGWFAVAPPLSIVAATEMAAAASELPAVLAVPEHDQFNDPDAAAAKTAEWTTTEIRPIAGADHFLAGQLSVVAEQFAEMVAMLHPSTQTG